MIKVGVPERSRGYPTDDEMLEAHFSSFEDMRPKRSYDPFGLVTVSKRMDKQDASAVLGTLVHESVHVFQFIVSRMGEKYPSSEFEAYGIQYIYSFMERWYSETRWNKRHGKKDAKAKDPGSTPRQVGAGNRKRVPRSR